MHLCGWLKAASRLTFLCCQVSPIKGEATARETGFHGGLLGSSARKEKLSISRNPPTASSDWDPSACLIALSAGTLPSSLPLRMVRQQEESGIKHCFSASRDQSGYFRISRLHIEFLFIMNEGLNAKVLQCINLLMTNQFLCFQLPLLHISTVQS